ncbi:MAG: transporter substrate-binding domain-containing protein [Gammaproteobacteria bacterium]|nr:transporter substrate-binding domain-containing protein [Gammaproteobacteria bacterium]
MKKLRIIWGLVVLLYGTAYAQSIVIGVAQSHPPFSKQTDSVPHFTGFEIELMHEICTRLKLTCSYKAVFGNKIIPALETGKIDLALNMIIIPKFRLFGLMLSLPYLPSNGRFLVLKDAAIDDVSDIVKKTIGIRLGAYQVNVESNIYIHHMFGDKVSVKGYETDADLLTGLAHHEVSAAFLNQYSAHYWHTASKGEYKYVGKTRKIGDGYGIMAKRNHKKLMLQINATIKKIMADGTYDTMYQRYLSRFQ